MSEKVYVPVGMQEFFEKLNLRKKLSLALVIMTVLPLVITTVMIGQSYEQAMKKAIFARNQKLAEQMAGEIDWKFAEKIRVLKLAANNADIRSMDPARQEKVLKDIADKYPDVQLAIIADAYGRQIARWDGKPVDRNIRYTYREYFHTVMQTGDAAISDIQMDNSNGKLGIVIAEPFSIPSSSLPGLIIINISVDKLINQLEGAKIGKTGYAYVVNPAGKIIIHPDQGLIKNGADESYVAPVKAAMSGQSGWMEYEFDHKKRLAGYSYAPSTKWGIIVQQPLDEAMVEVTKVNKMAIFITVGAAIIAGIIGLLLAGALTKPIADISEAVNCLAKGDLAIKLKVSTGDELGRLAATFNNMTAQLVKRNEALRESEEKYRSLVDQLEHQVEQRTRELTALNEELRRISFADGLTGIANRRYFNEFLAREWQRAKREGTPLGLIMLDIDFFKAYNDTYGHLAGDECLKNVAHALKTTVQRNTDLVARYGGEEFAIVLPNTDRKGAMVVGETLRGCIENLDICNEKSPIKAQLTISAGIAVMAPKHNEQPPNIIAAADGALYQAKQEGRNRIKIIL